MKTSKADVASSLNIVIYFIYFYLLTQVYKGYMDTLRNTDNAWMETATLHFHDETREILGDIEFEVW